MKKENQVKLDALMVKFAALGEEYNRIAFLKEWQPFLKSLTAFEQKIAVKAWFDTILATAKAVNKDIDHVVKNGTDEDVEVYRNYMKNLHEIPLFDKNMATI